MDTYFITPKEFEAERLVVKAVRKEKTPKHEFEKSDIFYKYPCRICSVEGGDCGVCGKDCFCGTDQGCQSCTKGKTYNDVTRELLVFMEDIKFDGGLFFSKDPKMYGGGSLCSPIDTVTEKSLDIFGDLALDIGREDGFLKRLRRSFLTNLRMVAPGKFPKNGAKFKEIEDVVNDKGSIRQDITIPLSEEERSADSSKKGVPVPSKYFRIKYFQQKKILEADESTLSVEQRRMKQVMLKQKMIGIDSRDVPVGAFTMTILKVATLDGDKVKTIPIKSFTVLKNKNLVANMMVKYSSATFTPKLSISEEIVEMTISSISSTERTSLLDKQEFINKLKLTSEQSRRNEEEIEDCGDVNVEETTQVLEPVQTFCDTFDMAAAGIPPPPP